MTYTIVANPEVEATFGKMAKKDVARFGQIIKKLQELGENPAIGKPLHRPMQGLRRVHIGHFILTYKFEKKKGLITLVDYAHHDEAYS
ncbi:MAG: type II toxin-antitoxin system RelE/ParE family toxin [Methanoregula sp.]|jgi:addiction module RelE/StbE family toxin|uniref:type II toxin-antitoxin system RelE family toxin n=1 Tax=Methanoregula sp. TaxID=2052170 RepID=UPI0025E9F84C|nr:type II toxin-antitoxin system RelE/ParE family toxin [Methanoregula sp.]MCK9631624.1 type II toxin-antitoxin system RelE/ParE family toxin [Methanoregula sp.]